MKMIEKIVKVIKSIFYKQEEIKMIEAPKEEIQTEKKLDFVQFLKVNLQDKMKKRKIEVIVCKGDGLGIRKKIRS